MAPKQRDRIAASRFSRSEAERILRDAAALEGEEGPADLSLTLAQLREIAAEAQIAPEFVDRAVRTAVPPRATKARDLLCGIAAGAGLVTGVNTSLVFGVSPAVGVGVMVGGTMLGAGVGLIAWRHRQHTAVLRLTAPIRAIGAHPRIRRIRQVLFLEPRIVLEPPPSRDQLPPA